MRNYNCLFALSCLFIAALLFGLVPQPPPTMVTATVTEGVVQFQDTYGRVVQPLLFKRIVPLSSEVADSEEVRLVEPKGTGSIACAYVDGYLVWAEGQMWGSLSNRAWDKAEETEDITVVGSGGYITGNAVAYNCIERREPDNEDQPKVIFVREPPRYLPPKRKPLTAILVSLQVPTVIALNSISFTKRFFFNGIILIGGLRDISEDLAAYYERFGKAN